MRRRASLHEDGGDLGVVHVGGTVQGDDCRSRSSGGQAIGRVRSRSTGRAHGGCSSVSIMTLPTSTHTILVGPLGTEVALDTCRLGTIEQVGDRVCGASRFSSSGMSRSPERRPGLDMRHGDAQLRRHERAGQRAVHVPHDEHQVRSPRRHHHGLEPAQDLGGLLGVGARPDARGSRTAAGSPSSSKKSRLISLVVVLAGMADRRVHTPRLGRHRTRGATFMKFGDGAPATWRTCMGRAGPTLPGSRAGVLPSSCSRCQRLRRVRGSGPRADARARPRRSPRGTQRTRRSRRAAGRRSARAGRRCRGVPASAWRCGCRTPAARSVHHTLVVHVPLWSVAITTQSASRISSSLSSTLSVQPVRRERRAPSGPARTGRGSERPPRGSRRSRSTSRAGDSRTSSMSRLYAMPRSSTREPFTERFRFSFSAWVIRSTT